MPRSEYGDPPRPPSSAAPGHTDDEGGTGDTEEVLSLLSDDHARAILAAVGEDSLPARELVDRLEASRATVYRRLNSLESAGLIRTRTAYHPDGHHRQEYSLALDRVELSLGAEGVDLQEPA